MAVSADICISVTPASRSPFFNMVKQTDSGMVELVIKPQGEVARRQDAPAVFDITTVVYATTPEFVLNHYGLFLATSLALKYRKSAPWILMIFTILCWQKRLSEVVNNGKATR